MATSPVNIIQWMIDTRRLWFGTEALPPKDQMREFPRTAATELQLLPSAEQEAVLKFYHARDAKMKLASYLLKHLAITQICAVPWSASTLSKASNHKPCYIPPISTSDAQTLEFNVSHQAGIVTIVAAAGQDIELGTDVVCVNERNEFAKFATEGLFAYIDMHADVFAASETQALKMDVASLGLPECALLEGYGRNAVARCQYPDQAVTWTDKDGEVQSLDAKRIVEAKLRRFYALWCVREAYVKMTGEALLAEWLRELEFRPFVTPKAAVEAVDNESLVAGEVVTEFEIFFKGGRVTDVVMELRAFGRDYMIASAARLNEGTLQGGRFAFSWINLSHVQEAQIQK